MDEVKKQKPALVPVGIILIILSFFSRSLLVLAKKLTADNLRALLLIFSDLLRLCFFIGLILLIIGIIKNRKLKMEGIIALS